MHTLSYSHNNSTEHRPERKSDEKKNNNLLFRHILFWFVAFIQKNLNPDFNEVPVDSIKTSRRVRLHRLKDLGLRVQVHLLSASGGTEQKLHHPARETCVSCIIEKAAEDRLSEGVFNLHQQTITMGFTRPAAKRWSHVDRENEGFNKH